MKPSKYRNIPTIVDGVRFASKAEAKRDAELRLLERGGLIYELTRQPRFPLVVNGVNIGTYVGDWKYWEYAPKGIAGYVVEDRKGVQTPAFKLKWKLCQALYPHFDWRLS